MARGRRRFRRKPPRPEDGSGVSEQADLLADDPRAALEENEELPPRGDGEAEPHGKDPSLPDGAGVRQAAGGPDEPLGGAGMEEPERALKGEPEEQLDPQGEGGEGVSGVPIPESPWEQKMAWAKERAQEGRREEAVELYRELLEEDPTSVRALNNMGILLDELGGHEEAAACLERALKSDPGNLEVAGNLGAVLGTMGKYVEAEEQLRRVLHHDPENLAVRANLGILSFRRGLYKQAEVELADVCRAQPDHGPAYFYRGEALNRLGRVEEAIEALRRSLELAPGNPRAYHTLGILFDKKNRPQEAAEMYRKSRELSPR